MENNTKKLRNKLKIAHTIFLAKKQYLFDKISIINSSMFVHKINLNTS